MSKKNEGIAAKLKKADDQLKDLNEFVVIEHEEGFNKALR